MKIGETIIIVLVVFACVFFPFIALPIVLIMVGLNWNKV